MGRDSPSLSFHPVARLLAPVTHNRVTLNRDVFFREVNKTRPFQHQGGKARGQRCKGVIICRSEGLLMAHWELYAHKGSNGVRVI